MIPWLLITLTSGQVLLPGSEILEVLGSYQHAIDIVGSYQPAIDVVGEQGEVT